MLSLIGALKKKFWKNFKLCLRFDFQETELLNVLHFMYNGEVNVAQNSLNDFLAAAEELAVKGED